jgi:hypothetical protein
MNIENLFLNPIIDTDDYQKNIVKLEQLLIDKSNDFSDNKYISQKIQNKLPNKFIYCLFNTNNKQNAVANLVYIGNNYFITILNKELYNSISRFSDNYYLQLFETQLYISSITGFPNHIENNFIISLIQLASNETNYNEFDIIQASMYLSYEQPGVSISYEINGIVNQNIINNINETYITIIDNNSFLLGSPIFIDNTLLGIYYRNSGNVCNFFRISSIYSWLHTFSLVIKNRVKNLPVYVPYSKEQMYHIILYLNDRINILENTISQLTLKAF